MANEIKRLKESVNKVIKRSQIKFNELNPKHHTDDAIRKQLKNFKKYGFDGGIVWNKRDGRLLAGHLRIKAMDLYYKYDDGTYENDYDVRVEVVDYDKKTALEQMTYMSGINDTKPDYNKIAVYADDIDLSSAGFTDDDIKQLKLLQDDLSKPVEDITNDDDMFLSEESEAAVNVKPVTELPKVEQTNDEIVEQHENKPKMTAEEVKAQKEHCNNVAQNRWEGIDTFIMIDFANAEQKAMFCDLLGKIPQSNMRITGDEILSMIE